jgi:acyl carrier protein phosphodiesterase
MNFLAHLYLSGESDGIKTGNFIGDYVKGSHYRKYAGDIQKGILLHRAIDHYTDNHPAFVEAKSYFKPAYGRYSGIVTDVVFDHLLASRWSEFSITRLKIFTRHTHAVLLSNFLILPFRVQQFLPVMITNKRLESYETLEGTARALKIMSGYTTLPDESLKGIELLQRNMAILNTLFGEFMADMAKYVETEHSITISTPDQFPVK